MDLDVRGEKFKLVCRDGMYQPFSCLFGWGDYQKKKGERGVNSISFPGDLNPKQILIGRMIGSALNWVGLLKKKRSRLVYFEKIRVFKAGYF